MQFGAAIWPFQWHPPYDDAIRRIAGLGFSNVELIAWDAAALDEHYTPQRVEALKRLLTDEGLTLSEFVSTPAGAGSPDATRRAAAVEYFKRVVDTAAALGTTMVNSVVSTPFDLSFPVLLELPESQEVTVELPRGLDWADGYKGYVETLQQCCAVCEEAGLRYALETHPHRWATTALSLLRLIEDVGSPVLGANLDPSHLFPCGDLPQVAVYQLGPNVYHTHFSDNDGQTNAHWRPGKGKIDWSATLQALQDIGYDGVISIELEDVPGRASKANPVAGDAFDRENQDTMRYLSGLAENVGINLR
ncbi:MAG: sugar phosphate isomerase/epimerase [Chloroflexota bacterium]|nr:sugar phosphate isomerase/epimerase [Chloroflexota bacterium]